MLTRIFIFLDTLLTNLWVEEGTTFPIFKLENVEYFHFQAEFYSGL